MDGDIIINMGFFIHDLHQQIEQLHQHQLSSYHDKPFIVYRGQGLSNANFEKLQETKGGLMSFNNFLSTSKDKEVSIGYADIASTVPDKVGILFTMSINPCIKSTPFARITELSYYEAQEEEVLFSMHTVFRVNEIKQMDSNNQLYQVELQLTSDDDQQLRLLTDRIRKEVGGTGWQRLGDLLLKIGQLNKAEELYNVLLEQTSDKGEKAIYYNQIGYVHSTLGDYGNAISYYEQGLKIQQKSLPSNHPSLAISYTNIGVVYKSMEEYSKALLFYEKALEIRQKTLSSNHLELAVLYSNIGGVYNSMKEYLKALSSHEKALEIREKTLSSDHPSLATSYNSIGGVCGNMKDYSRALSFYEKALKIRQKTLPSNHPSLAISYNNMAKMYYNMKDYSKALSYFERALGIFQRALPSTHFYIKTVKENIETVKNKL
ncbi:unnamed protein product [Adineta steineri]|uniref:NAD(P)(+)--arginine ADP-ribosyltransferase n=1 Tax=Adineta steineri TaxID=433720 RepID=A0A814DP19_9BILA|nr:unnamed protein product [Adineta steineri]CAF0957127.1 unnamed protein product [Adineta steineri]CAF0962176.1 unnamed protein product [Adineta steineri]